MFLIEPHQYGIHERCRLCIKDMTQENGFLVKEIHKNMDCSNICLCDVVGRFTINDKDEYELSSLTSEMLIESLKNLTDKEELMSLIRTLVPEGAKTATGL